LKLCERCFKEFDEDESVDYSPARELGDIFISSVSKDDIQEFCPQCREELGVINLMGFRRPSLS
jgi:hypothetical protein